MGRRRGLLLVVLLSLACEARADERRAWKPRVPDGRWRLELSAWKGIDAGKIERLEDRSLQGTVEYEVPLGRRFTAGLRAMPLFLYEDWNAGHTIHGAALGPTFRVYAEGDRTLWRRDRRCFRRVGGGTPPAAAQRDRRRTGPFLEVGVSALLHDRHLHDNAARFNFVTEVGVGWSFGGRFHVALKWHHISNANSDWPNSATEGLGIAVGFTF